MKHNYLLFLIFFFSTLLLNAQIVSIPDPIFKNRLLNYTPTIDTNSNGEIEISEAELVVALNVKRPFSENNYISDLTGLEAFANLSSLIVSYNDITSFDFSIFTDLQILEIISNNFSSIDLTQNNALTLFHCGSNSLTSLNLSSNGLLNDLDISRNFIASIDLSQNTQLEYFKLSNNLISDLDLSNNVLLKRLTSFDTPLSSINLSNNINLEEATISNTQLTELNFLNNPQFYYLILQLNSQLENIDLTGATGLEVLYVFQNNQLTELDVSQNAVLEDFQSQVNFGITNLDFTNNELLENVLISRSSINEVDFSQNSNLTNVNINNNYLLNHINLKNGNNVNTSLNAYSNANLQTICVDEVGYAETNFRTNVQAQTIFVEDCNATTVNYNLISGIVTYDVDNDGCDDTSDYHIPNLLVTANDGTNEYGTFTNETGEFFIDVPSGNYSTTISGLLDVYSLDPLSVASNFTGLGETSAADFCVTADQNVYDLEIILLPIDEARPGFDASYQLVYKNVGYTVISGSISFQYYDTQQTFVSSSQTPNINTVNSLSFDFTDLEPFETRTIDITMQTFAPPTVNTDDILDLAVSITPNNLDITPENNSYNLEQVVVNSYDPNDKQVLQGSTIFLEQVSEYLDYVIRFQNTGTASAINVTITDQLDYALDWSTLQPVSSSHNYDTRITNDNFVEFVFENINLPAEQDYSEESNGFIAFRVKPYSDVPIGYTFYGKANIYFDYNAPIITNTVSTQIVEPLSIDEIVLDNNIKIYPNPTSGLFNIHLKDGIILEKIELMSLTGQKIYNSHVPSLKVDLSNYSSGLYFIKITTNKGIVNKRIIKE